MLHKITICDSKGKEYGVLDNVEESTTLSDL